MLSVLREWLLDPQVAGVDVDDPALLARHQQVASRKPLLVAAFRGFYLQLLSLRDRHVSAPDELLEVELGSGAGMFRAFHPRLVTTDIRPGVGIDRVVDALAMPFADGSVRCLYAINVFHHLPDPGRFFREAARVLAPGGGCLLVEPHGGLLSAAVHRRLHRDEHYDPHGPWRNPGIRGPLGGANQALAEIVFRRDRSIFEQRHGGDLEIVERPYCLNALRYLGSGGVNFRALLPAWSAPWLERIERAGAPLARLWTLHQVTVLRRR